MQCWPTYYKAFLIYTNLRACEGFIEFTLKINVFEESICLDHIKL